MTSLQPWNCVFQSLESSTLVCGLSALWCSVTQAICLGQKIGGGLWQKSLSSPSSHSKWLNTNLIGPINPELLTRVDTQKVKTDCFNMISGCDSWHENYGSDLRIFCCGWFGGSQILCLVLHQAIVLEESKKFSRNPLTWCFICYSTNI